MDIFTTHNAVLAPPLRHSVYPDTDMLNSHRELIAEQIRINNAAAMTEYTTFTAPPLLKTSGADNYQFYQFLHGQVSPLPSPTDQHALDSGSDTTSWPRSEQQQPLPLFSGSEPTTQFQDNTSSAYSSNVHSPSITDATSEVSPMLLLQTAEQGLHEHANPHTYQFMAEQSPHGQASPHSFDVQTTGQSHQDHASPHTFQEFTQSPVEQQQQQLYSQHHHQMPQQSPLPFDPQSTFLNPWHHPAQNSQTLPLEVSHAGAFFIPQNPSVSSSSSSLPYQQHQMGQVPYPPTVRRSEPQVSMHSWGPSPVQSHAQRAYASESYPASHGVALGGLPAAQAFPSQVPPHHAAQVQHQIDHCDGCNDTVQQEQEENRRRIAYMQQQRSVHPDPIQPSAYQQLEDYQADFQEGLENAQQTMSQAVSPPRASSAETGATRQRTAGGAKRKRSPNMTTEERRDLNLQRNREAAAKCRGKKKERDNKTSKQCASLQERNLRLRQNRNQMQDELSILRDQILTLAATGCRHEMGDIKQWIATNSKTGGCRFRKLMTDWTLTTKAKDKRKELTKTDVEAAKMVEKMDADESRADMDAASDSGSFDFSMDDEAEA